MCSEGKIRCHSKLDTYTDTCPHTSFVIKCVVIPAKFCTKCGSFVGTEERSTMKRRILPIEGEDDANGPVVDALLNCIDNAVALALQKHECEYHMEEINSKETIK